MIAKSPDLNDSLDDLIGAPVTAPKQPPATYTPRDFTEPCRKCRGSGFWRPGYPCFACKGVGKKTFKTSAETRAKVRADLANSRMANAEELAQSAQAWAAANPDVNGWIINGNGRNTFATSLFQNLLRYGSLTQNQTDAVRRAIAKDAERAEARKVEATNRIANAPVVDTSALEAAFAKAAAKLQRPKLRLAGFTVSRAKPDSANPGALYVKGDGGLYLGKIAGGKFVRSRECNAETEKQVLDVALDPKGAAIAYGKLYGNCAVCSRQLTDPVSVANGIGPVCAENFGW